MLCTTDECLFERIRCHEKLCTVVCICYGQYGIPGNSILSGKLEMRIQTNNTVNNVDHFITR